MLIKNALHFSGLVSCGLIRRAVILWILPRFLHLHRARQSIPVSSEHSVTWVNRRHELDVSLRRDPENWGSHRGLQMEHAVAMKSSRKLFYFILVIRRRTLSVKERIRGADGSLIPNQL